MILFMLFVIGCLVCLIVLLFFLFFNLKEDIKKNGESCARQFYDINIRFSQLKVISAERIMVEGELNPYFDSGFANNYRNENDLQTVIDTIVEYLDVHWKKEPAKSARIKLESNKTKENKV